MKILKSDKWELIPLEKRKLLTSAGYGLLAVLALALASYLEQFGLPEQFEFLAPLVPVGINFLVKWSGTHTYATK